MNSPLRDFAIGPLSFRLDVRTGHLRDLRHHGHEVLRGIYPAVRDAGWATLLPQTGEPSVAGDASSLRIELQARVTAGEVALDWTLHIHAEAAGRLFYRWEAQARSAYRTNRTGLCVLHPAELAGQPCTVEHADGRIVAGWFPAPVAPHQPFTDVRAIVHRFAPGAEATVRMEGEIFEMEDQRNWSDASYKTYSRPLAWPRPYEIAAGETLEQAVTVTLAGRPPPVPAAVGPVRLAAAGERVAWPRVGFGLPGPLPAALRDRARALRPTHVRVETTLPEAGATLRWARAEADALGCPLELALRGATRTPEDLPGLRPGDTLALFDADGNTLPADILAAWHESANAQLAAGTLHHFTELNRRRPSAAAAHALTNFGLTAQVHAFDDASMLETISQHAPLARYAATFGEPRPVSVSPIALGPTGASADPRLHAEFGALWTLASLLQLARAGVARATYFRLHGPGGFLREEAPTPVEHLFLALGGSSQAELLALEGQGGRRAPAHAAVVSGPAGRRLVIAHLGDTPLELAVPFAGERVDGTAFTAGTVRLAPRALWQLALAS